MTQPSKKPVPQPVKQSDSEDIADQMSKKIQQCAGLSNYTTRELVEDTQKLGGKLASIGLKTTQVRKFFRCCQST
ncbi:MAG: hypothetical protein HC769_27350 [Cyanobacteria bacterium CRU_2_1]|nr:hypothetical protein [Cyanobacteria bacterium CRU_2_1]